MGPAPEKMENRKKTVSEIKAGALWKKRSNTAKEGRKSLRVLAEWNEQNEQRGNAVRKIIGRRER